MGKMGIRDFSKAFNACQIVTWKDFKGQTLAVDAMTELYRAALGAASVKTLTDPQGNPTIHLSVFLSNILKAKKCGVKLIYVFDHDDNASESKEFHNPAKIQEMIRRRKRKQDAKEKLDALADEDSDSDDYTMDVDDQKIKTKSSKTASKNLLEKTIWKPSREQVNDIKLMLECFNIPWAEAPATFEGEQAATSLVIEGKADAVYSCDSDPIAFGAPVLYKLNARKKKIYKYTQSDILRQIDEKLSAGYQYESDDSDDTQTATVDTMLKIFVMLGTDYTKRIPKMGPKTIWKRFGDYQLTKPYKDAIQKFKQLPRGVVINQSGSRSVSELIEWLVNIKGFNRKNLTKRLQHLL